MPCQIGQGRRFQINLAGCIEIYAPDAGLGTGVGGFLREMQICLPGFDRVRRNLNRYQFLRQLEIQIIFRLTAQKMTSYFGENVESRFSRQIALAIPGRML